MILVLDSSDCIELARTIILKYAIAAIGGKQYKLEEGKQYKFDRFSGEVENVLFYRDDAKIEIGTPKLESVTIKTEKLEDKNDKKVEVRRYRAKSRYRRNKGHRQPVTLVKVTNIDSK